MRGMRLSGTIGILAAIVITSCGGGGGPVAQTSAASATPVATRPAGFDEAAEAKKLYEAAVAANETEVNVYGSINEEEAKPLLDIWTKAYPKVKANYIRGSETALLSRILTEEQAGKHNFDVLSTTSGHLLAPAGLALQWTPPNAALVDADYKDRAGMWTGIYANWNVIQVNTDKVKKGEIKTYEDVANPKWKGQVAIDVSDYDWYAGLVATRGQSQTDELLKKIVATTGVTVVDGHGNINDRLVAGEFAIALNQFLNQAERSKRLGAPTDWIPIEPVVVQLGKIALSKNAPHPNAAKLLANFLISLDGQKYLASRGRIITRTDVPNDPPNLVTGLRKYAPTPLVDPELARVAGQFKTVFK